VAKAPKIEDRKSQAESKSEDQVKKHELYGGRPQLRSDLLKNS
jgi:hypothetical protein